MEHTIEFQQVGPPPEHIPRDLLSCFLFFFFFFFSSSFYRSPSLDTVSYYLNEPFARN